MTERPRPSLADPSPPLLALAAEPSQPMLCSAPLLSRVEEKVKDRGQELEEVGGSNCEAMTNLNSAPEDLFADI